MAHLLRLVDLVFYQPISFVVVSINTRKAVCHAEL